VPTLVDGSVRLTESMAICEYLAAKYDSPLLVGTGDPARTDFVQWLWYGESTLMTPLARRATVTRLGRKGPDIDAVLDDARGNAGMRLIALERRLEGRDFLVAGRLTLADISAGYPLHLVGLFGMDDLLGPRSTAYRERLRSRPAYQRAISVE
jgi:glutathione S-transferase